MRLSAPFVPFLADAVYRRLGGAKESVHLDLYPGIDESAIDADLEKKMAGVLKTVSVGHSLRHAAQLKVRTPLAEIFVHSPYPTETEWLGSEEFAYLVRDELNIKKITLLNDPGTYVKYRVKADFAKLKRFGKNMKAAAALLESLDPAMVKAILAKGEASIELAGKKEVITKEEVQILQENAGRFRRGGRWGPHGHSGYAPYPRASPGRDGAGDRQPHPEFPEGIRFRGERSHRLSCRAPEEVSVVLRQFGEHICVETLAELLEEGEDWPFRTDFKAGEHTIELWMKRPLASQPMQGESEDATKENQSGRSQRK